MDESNNVLVEDTENERTVAVYEWVEAAIFALVCVVLVFTFLFRIVGVDGESMQTTLMDHDRLILTRLNYTPERGDIVVINRYTQEPLVKPGHCQRKRHPGHRCPNRGGPSQRQGVG